jgi:hypothetical protein
MKTHPGAVAGASDKILLVRTHGGCASPTRHKRTSAAEWQMLQGVIDDLKANAGRAPDNIPTSIERLFAQKDGDT